MYLKLKQLLLFQLSELLFKENSKVRVRSISINIPRDLNGDFELQIVPKRQRNINGIEDKILSFYATGITTRDISEQVKRLYDIEISAETVSNITNRILPSEKIYSFIFTDAIHYKVREEKHAVVKAAYVVIGVNLYGEKEVLRLWIGTNENGKFRLYVLNDLKNRGVQDVLIFCVYGLNGFKEAIGASFPFAKI